jgi:hypothetical protein
MRAPRSLRVLPLLALVAAAAAAPAAAQDSPVRLVVFESFMRPG